MAHATQITGRLSEITAQHALIANGWEVAEPSVAEVYDFVAKDPVNGQWYTFQCKTINRRADRNNELVVRARKSNGEAYTPHDCDYLIGVETATGATYMFACTGNQEYWASDDSAKVRWHRLKNEQIEATAEAAQ